ncbi:MAG TPA: TlpA disulfide reductase family protein [Anaerolineales bacterium]|nr:TlpA disulfide reductase family protein [Anaerolineales bacterium]
MFKRFWKPFVLIFIIGLLSVTWYTKYAEMERLESLPVGTEVGERAPEFTGTTVDGETVSLSDYRGRIVLVNDFATWCGPCIFETPHLVDVYNKHMNDVVVIGLNLGEQDVDVAAYQVQFSISYPLLLDPDGRLTETYKPLGLPTSWFIDEDGVIRFVYTGPMTIEMIEEILEAIRDGREPDLFS